MRGTVMNVQKGQHGPAMTMGVPSVFSTRANIPPICRAQQQNHRSMSRRGSPEHSGCFFPAALSSSISLSHLTDTAYLKCTSVNHYSSSREGTRNQTSRRNRKIIRVRSITRVTGSNNISALGCNKTPTRANVNVLTAFSRFLWTHAQMKARRWRAAPHSQSHSP